MLIEEAHKDEYEKIADMVNVAYAVPFLPDMMATKANDSAEKIVADTEKGAHILVAYQEKELLGTIRYRPIDNDSLYCYKLAVKPDHRKLGIGKVLINEVLSIAHQLGLKNVEIEVAEAKGLVPYYESMGFFIKERNLVKNHYEVKMSKKIF
jgi:GNAT superfamily N-acetyltransferase